MTVDRVKTHLKQWDRDADVIELESSTATVPLAAAALGVEPGRIAKTLSFRGDVQAMLQDEALSKAILVVASGDARVDNGKFKALFGFKARMLSAEEAFGATGYRVGGVCPFGVEESVAVYLDVSLKRYDRVYPACGASNALIGLTIQELEHFSNSKAWVDVCTVANNNF